MQWIFTACPVFWNISVHAMFYLGTFCSERALDNLGHYEVKQQQAVE